MADLKESVQTLRNFLRRQVWQRYNTGEVGFSLPVQGNVLARVVTEVDEKGQEKAADFIVTGDWDILSDFFTERGYSLSLEENGRPVVKSLKREVIAS